MNTAIKGSRIFALLLLTILSSCMNEEPEVTDAEKIDSYIVSSGITGRVVLDHSTGIRLVVHEFGQNPPPHEGQRVKAVCTGRLLADPSKIFREGPIDAVLDGIDPAGLRYSLSTMMSGTHATIFLPSALAYGEHGTTNVPPNSIVFYEVKLTEVIKTAAETTQFQEDSVTISNYLASKAINATRHSSGIWYTIEKQGTGATATLYNQVDIGYTMSLLDSITVDTGTLRETVIVLIDGARSGMHLMNEGSEATFYIPSGLGYGKEGTTGIPKDANLVFKVTLNDIIE